ncbi:hypothetical protein BD410DRAFT_793875 [Rickenella mellea]|uniref:Uncharacterized protein n=1 Tax=Rickenella mellea TaxID=50990 RepID=A0A4Y7PTI1_9AGAM|nr:hypothetical protein BD410DRAFT_793875 [Rickenella mellea]
MYALETSFRDADEEGFLLQYHAQKSSIVGTIELLQDWIWNADLAAAFKSIEGQLRTLQLLFATEPSSPHELYIQLEMFRSAWVTLWLNSSPSLLPSPSHGLLLNNLCDAATHLQKFPHATRDTQRAAFTFLDKLFRTTQHKVFGTLPSNRHSITTTCFTVLCSRAPKELAGFNRVGILASFVNRVHVFGCEGYRFPTSGDTMEIPFDVYSKIIADLVLTIQRGKVETKGIHQRREFYLDTSAEAIQNIISCRLDKPNSHDKVNSFLIDAKHLTALRATRELARYGYLWHWGYLVERTAKEFGYSFQLEDSYNIDIHAELLYYDVGIEPLLFEDTA